MPQPDDNGLPEVSDGWIKNLIRRVRGLSSDAVVSLRDVRAWRVALRREARRMIRARRDREPYVSGSDPWVSSDAAADVRTVFEEIGTSFYAQAALHVMMTWPVWIDGSRYVTDQSLITTGSDAAAPVQRYLAAKVGATPWPPGRGRRGATYVSKEGEIAAVRPPDFVGPTPAHIAAVNAVTLRRARDWSFRLSMGETEIRMVLSELDEIGEAAALSASPLPIWQPEDGPPRGIWPDPPPPEDGSPTTSALAPVAPSKSPAAA